MGVPLRASAEDVSAALLPAGEGVRRRLLDAVTGADRAAAERAARALKKMSERQPSALHGLRKQLIAAAIAATDVRVQWNLTLVLGRLPLRGRDKAVVVDLLFERLRDASGLNRTFAMQALMDLSEDDPALRNRVLPIVHHAEELGTPAMRARARKLLKHAR